MPRKEISVIEDRLRLVAGLLDGPCGHDRLQIFNCYKEDGLEALTDRSRRPVRCAN